MFTTFAVAATVVGIFAGVFAGKDGTRFFVGLAYAFALVAAIALLFFASGALFFGVFLFSPFLSSSLLFGAIMSVAYAAAFTAAQRFRSDHAASSQGRAV